MKFELRLFFICVDINTLSFPAHHLYINFMGCGIDHKCGGRDESTNDVMQ